MIKALHQVLSGEVNTVDINYVCPEDVLTELIKFNASYGGKLDWDIDTNGWQYDYWIHITIKNKKYILSGSGYYQHYVTFKLDED